ncbi:hypothetical protein [Erythrobacter sp. SCSIO 43205]|uniref:hypothetical protein n=1 Tax=Erythrobacter sp. SCSIO 43205 TaxID=2779361 RepID=UPI001CA8FDF5|nr:hypothetical protein [Erythrobacter sp. SCSIO 43205]
MRFFGFDHGGTIPDENTIRHYRKRLTTSGTFDALIKAFEQQLHERGYLTMGGQIGNATLVPVRKQRKTEEEKATVKAGRSAKQIWPGKPNKAHQKDVDVRWTVKVGGKVRYRPDGTPLLQIATPVFDYKSHISIDRRFGFIRKGKVTSAAHSDGRELRHVIDPNNTASDVWADSSYRSRKNETWLARHIFKSRIQRRKPKHKLMPERTSRINAAKLAVRAKVEHVCAHRNGHYVLFIRTIGLARAQA